MCRFALFLEILALIFLLLVLVLNYGKHVSCGFDVKTFFLVMALYIALIAIPLRGRGIR